jgi:hypothetical protein
LASIVAAL